MPRPTNAAREAAQRQQREDAMAAVASFGRAIPELQAGENTIPVGLSTDDLLHERDMRALVETTHADADALLEEQARVAGKDTATWKRLVELDPALAEEVYRRASETRAQAQRDDHFYFAKERDVSEIAAIVNGMTTDQQKRFTQTLVPEDKKKTHMALWDPPMRDGKVYGYSLIANNLVPKKLDTGWGIVPKGPLAAKPHLQCDMTDDTGVVCTKRFRTEQQVQRHRVVKHTTAYNDQKTLAAERQAEARELSDQQRADRLEQLVEQQAQMIAALTAKLGT